MPKLKLNIFRLITILLLCVCGVSFAFAAKDKPFVVVIDAGHGGKDLGAFENNLKEKDITLAISQKLEALLKNKKGVKVVMTRDADKFVTLSDRIAKAQKANADIFISIHVNSLASDVANRSNIEGAQVYLLGSHSNAETLAVAMRENAVIAEEKDYQQRYNKFNPNKPEDYDSFEYEENPEVESNSIGLAQEVYKELLKTAGRRERGVHEAEFIVLRDLDIPAILVEVDYLSNPASANFIGKSAGQKKIAQGIAKGIEAYRNALKKNPNAFAGRSLNGDEDSNTDGLYVLESDKSKSLRRTTSATNQKTSNKNQPTYNGERRRRSASARIKSENQNYETAHIEIHEESAGGMVTQNSTNRGKTTQAAADNSPKVASKNTKNSKSDKKEDKKKSSKEDKKKSSNDEEKQETRIVNGKKVIVTKISSQPSNSNPRSTKSKKPTTYNEPEPEQVGNAVAKSFGKKVDSKAEKKATETTVNYDELPAASESVTTNTATARKRVKTEQQNSASEPTKSYQDDEDAYSVQKYNRVQKKSQQKNNEEEYSTETAPKSLKSKKK